MGAHAGLPAIVRPWSRVRSRPRRQSRSSARPTPPPRSRVHWLGRVPYRDAWDLQKRLAAARAEGRDRRPAAPPRAPRRAHARAPGGRVARARAAGRASRPAASSCIRVERGGEVTYHGPGQLVAYPILRLADRGLLLRPLRPRARGGDDRDLRRVRRRRPAGATATRAAGSTRTAPRPRKIGALGIRVERGVAYHGIALNVDVALADFELIDPCGMPGLVSTSIAARARPHGRGAVHGRRGRGGRAFARPSPPRSAMRRSTASCRPTPTRPPSAPPSSGSSPRGRLTPGRATAR